MKVTQRQRVRRWLEEHGSITNVEAMHSQIFRLSERIRELQAEGMKITGDWVRVGGKKTGTYQYVLDGGPEPKLEWRAVEVNGVRMMRRVPVTN